MKLLCVFIITDKAKASRGGGKRCRCYERRRANKALSLSLFAKLEEIEARPEDFFLFFFE